MTDVVIAFACPRCGYQCDAATEVGLRGRLPQPGDRPEKRSELFIALLAIVTLRPSKLLPGPPPGLLPGGGESGEAPPRPGS